ncbi:Uncharacterised protein [Citrobacter koseri]|uniref:Uncharacterized protein n=1 Tax=Citrobacter koseri TaxID=545 RepID=A0A3S4KLL4_CITKO|nr:Uncharacterised protein [Citrobacter koseri]
MSVCSPGANICYFSPQVCFLSGLWNIDLPVAVKVMCLLGLGVESVGYGYVRHVF